MASIIEPVKMSEPLYEKVIYQNDEKQYQLRLVVNTFKEVEYLHIRKYFLSFDEGYLPSKEGISIKLSLANAYSLLDGLAEICSQREADTSVSEHFKELINKISLDNK